MASRAFSFYKQFSTIVFCILSVSCGGDAQKADYDFKSRFAALTSNIQYTEDKANASW